MINIYINCYNKKNLKCALNGIFIFICLSQKRKKILLLGLDSSGKTTYLSILQKLYLQPPLASLSYPTLGFNTIQLHINSTLNLWDLGGSESVRTYWKCYFSNVKGVIYFIDSSDDERKDLALKILKSLVYEIKDCVFLILMSKKDSQNKINLKDEIQNIMKNVKYNCFDVTCYDAIGVKESFLWLNDQIQ